MTMGRIPTDDGAGAEAIAARWDALRARIAQAAAAAGRDPAAIRVVAVTKGFGIEIVRAAVAIGLHTFGENRVQEAEPKIAAAPDAEWHLVGHLQRNKAKFVPGRFAVVHSVDSVDLARELDRRAAAAGARVRVLLQVNVAGEEQKNGCEPADAPALARAVRDCGALALEGLMTLAPFTDDVTRQRATFRGLRELRDRISEEGQWLPTLSMGMSGDYASAVAEGATLIRLGTAL
ncbi:MAG TPA: YggS family pyridoxal phosphate-dependent enzyme, partial [Methylomirabilota bacterium]|nr:YggS family pyridoxal phosphate-dependent enzyme [Methylomirabilota bacterium]